MRLLHAFDASAVLIARCGARTALVIVDLLVSARDVGLFYECDGISCLRRLIDACLLPQWRVSALTDTCEALAM